jgi:hypothetical protein
MSANAYNAINSDLSGIDFIAIFGNASATKVLTDEGPFEQVPKRKHFAEKIYGISQFALIISRFDAFYRLFPEFVGRNE